MCSPSSDHCVFLWLCFFWGPRARSRIPLHSLIRVLVVGAAVEGGKPGRSSPQPLSLTPPGGCIPNPTERCNLSSVTWALAQMGHAENTSPGRSLGGILAQLDLLNVEEQQLDAEFLSDVSSTSGHTRHTGFFFSSYQEQLMRLMQNFLKSTFLSEVRG